MREIKITVEGQDAVEATNALLEMPGITGNSEIIRKGQKELTLTVVITVFLATAVAVKTTAETINSIMELAEKIDKWWKVWKRKKEKKKIDRGVIIIDGRRFLLKEETTKDDIIKFLENPDEL